MEFILTLLAATSILWGGLFRDADTIDDQQTIVAQHADEESVKTN
jgi:hypothetical protein